MSDYFQTTWSLNHGIETFEVSSRDPFLVAGVAKARLNGLVMG